MYICTVTTSASSSHGTKFTTSIVPKFLPTVVARYEGYGDLKKPPRRLKCVCLIRLKSRFYRDFTSTYRHGPKQTARSCSNYTSAADRHRNPQVKSFYCAEKPYVRYPTSIVQPAAQTAPTISVGASGPTTRADQTRSQRMTGPLPSPATPMRAQRANRSPSSGSTDSLPAPLKRTGLSELL